MDFKDIAKRITGISILNSGVSWNPPEPESDVAQRVISELEDRRVLYNPSEMELPAHCVESIIQIRRMLTCELKNLDQSSNLAASLKAMRAACRKFLDTVQTDERIIKFGASHNHFASWQFNGAVGELRGVFGIYIAQIAVQYGINVDQPLSTILPIEAD